MGSISAIEIRAMQQLAQEAWRLEPTHVDVTLGELAYVWGVQNEGYSSEWRHRLWMDGNEALAWGWLFLPGSLEFQIHPGHAALLPDVLDWFEATAGDVERSVSVRVANRQAGEELERRGFRRDDDTPWMRLNLRELAELEEPHLPTGFRFLTMADAGVELSKRVAVHQAAWSEFGTRVTDDTYPRVIRTWPYRPELDLLVEAPDGSPVAFALAWYDDANLIGEFEPVGTDPRFRRLGLGRAVNLFGLQRLREAGATHAIVASRGDEGYPIPSRLYEAIGFRVFSRNCRYVKAGLETQQAIGEAGEDAAERR